MIIIFWVAFSILFLTWIGYPLILRALTWLFYEESEVQDFFPSITIMLTVHNEEKLIARRIKNLLEVDYPRDRLDFLAVSDGSIDKTNDILMAFAREHPAIRLIKTLKLGKSGAQNLAIPQARGEIILLSDAETLFTKDTVRLLVRHFINPRVGCVSGRMVLRGREGSVSRGHSLYWHYEMWLRIQESRLGLLHTGSGVALAFRKSLFRPLSHAHGDDCAIPLDTLLQGYRVVHEEQALAYDVFPTSVAGELRARIRMTLRNLVCTLAKYQLLNPFEFPTVCPAILFHKLFRWLTPYFMLLLLLTNLFLLGHNSFYRFSLSLQILFYLLGVIGFIASKNNRRIPLASQVFNFILANFGFFLGVLKAIFGKKITSYENKFL